MCRATEGVEGVMGKLVGRVVRVGNFLAISHKLSGVHGRGASTASSLSRTCARRGAGEHGDDGEKDQGRERAVRGSGQRGRGRRRHPSAVAERGRARPRQRRGSDGFALLAVQRVVESGEGALGWCGER